MVPIWVPTADRVANAAVTDLMAHFNAKLAAPFTIMLDCTNSVCMSPKNSGMASGNMRDSLA